MRCSLHRRDFLKVCGSAALAALFPATALLLTGCDDEAETLLLQGGLVFVGGGFSRWDLLVSHGVVEEMDNSGRLAALLTPWIDRGEVTSKDCRGQYISPGWVDSHCHVGGMGLSVDRLGPKKGVTALVDAGTYGPETFASFAEGIVPEAPIPLYAMLNLRKDGITLANLASPNGPGVEDVVGARLLAAQRPDLIRGLKVRIDQGNLYADDPLFLARATASLGEELNLPVMYHLGASPPTLLDFLFLARPGDIISHAFRKDNAVVSASGALKPEVSEALARGVRFDLAHGMTSFSFETAKAALDQGFRDFTLSTDLHLLSSMSGDRSLFTVASSCLALGLSLEEVIRAVAVVPRERLGLESGITKGARLSLTIFKQREGLWLFHDTEGQTLSCKTRLDPVRAFLGQEATG
ncbi:hypothetical protein [Desulfoluna sp.]|uniref:hypothetical protein n=1 Tax=Desulfoluna sp. TaxID=2045199 RepID=UPI002614AA58|nr:hypothetical protein [Desulfoluna sp.]